MHADQANQKQWFNTNVLARNESKAHVGGQQNASSLTVGSLSLLSSGSETTAGVQVATSESMSEERPLYMKQGANGNYGNTLNLGMGSYMNKGFGQQMIQQQHQMRLGVCRQPPPNLQPNFQEYIPNILPPITNNPAVQHLVQLQVQNLQPVQDVHSQRDQYQIYMSNQGVQRDKHKVGEPIRHAVGQSFMTSKRTMHENILKLVAHTNKDKPLEECASNVRAVEVELLNMDSLTHSKSDIQAAEQRREHERQVYALIWLMNNCIPDTESFVPRGRIFAQYASSCASNNLKPLSQATLGKLIRSLFPYLKTRRLGMRGQSKYHYCGLKLASSLLSGDLSISKPTPVSNYMDVPVSVLTADNSCDKNENKDTPPTQESGNNDGADSSGVAVSATSVNRDSNQSTSTSFDSNELKSQEIHTLAVLNDSMKFIDDFFSRTCENKVELPLAFPPIILYLPPNVDMDIASSVESLYKVFCNQLFENIRFMKFDDLPSTLESFSSGSISPQMYNLFISEKLYAWIEKSDLITYKALAKMFSSLIVECHEIPRIVLDKLSHFSATYLDLVSKSTIDLPLPVVTSKKRMVTKFTQLVKRLIKVIDTGKHASKVLETEQVRASMHRDWECFVNIDEILDWELVYMQDQYPNIRNKVTEFLQKNLLEILAPREAGLLEGNSNRTIRLTILAKKLSVFLTTWDDIPAKLVALTMVSLTTSILRSLSLNSAGSFGAWWIIKCFIDEWIYWCGEIGFFLD